MTDGHPLSLPLERETVSEEETRALGRTLAEGLGPGDLVLMEGELGSGKTVLCRGLAEGLGVDPDRVRSPTFNILFTYRGRVPVHHIDLYRLEDEEEIRSAGVEEVLWDRDGVVLVEWAERLEGIDHPPAIRIHLRGAGAAARQIRVAPPDGP